MDYTFANVKLKINQMSDKMGSDYFVAPVILNFIESATYDFIGERLKHVELTQEITDDINPLISRVDLDADEDENISGRYVVSIPSDYLRRIAQTIYYSDGSECRRSDLIRHAERNHKTRNPNTAPTKNYPLILQFADLFQIDCGPAVPSKMSLTYCKKPTFSTIAEQNKRIINLPDDAIEKILKMTVTNLFLKTGDERVQPNYNFQEAYRKIFK